MAPFKLYIPKRIIARWAKHHNLPQRKVYAYQLTSVLETAKVSAEEFRKCWRFVRCRLPADELFSLFKDSGFSSNRYEETGKLAFVRNVLQYKDEQVCFWRPPPPVHIKYLLLCLLSSIFILILLHHDVPNLIYIPKNLAC